MFIIGDRAAAVAEHFGKPLLALYERLIAKIVGLQLDEVEGD
jgi:hypothetical protein